MFHLLASEVTAIGAFLAVVSVMLYHWQALVSQPPSLGSLLTAIGFVLMMRNLAGGRPCPRALQSPAVSEGRAVLVTGADGMMGHNLCKGLVGTGATVVVCCRTVAASRRTAEGLNSYAEGKGYLGRAVFVDGAPFEATCIPSMTAYVRALKAFLEAEALVLDTAVLAVGMISPTLKYVDIATGEAVSDAFPETPSSSSGSLKAKGSSTAAVTTPIASTTCELMVASNSIAAHHMATLMMPLLAQGGGGGGGAEKEATAAAARRFDHARRLVIVASSAHTHLGAFGGGGGGSTSIASESGKDASAGGASPIMMLKCLHRFMFGTLVEGKGKDGAAAKATSATPPPSALCKAMARAVFYPDFVKIYGLSKLINIYSGLTLIEMAEKQREAFLKSRLASSGGGIKAKFEALPQGQCDADPKGAAKIVKVVMIHPGIFGSGLYRRLLPQPLLWIAGTVGMLVMKSGWESCQTALYTCLEDWGKLQHGGYYYDCREYGTTSPVCNSLSDAALNAEERKQVVEWMNSTILCATRRGRELQQQQGGGAPAKSE